MIHYKIGFWPSQLHIVIYTQIIGFHIDPRFFYFGIHVYNPLNQDYNQIGYTYTIR